MKNTLTSLLRWPNWVVIVLHELVATTVKPKNLHTSQMLNTSPQMGGFIIFGRSF